MPDTRWSQENLRQTAELPVFPSDGSLDSGGQAKKRTGRLWVPLGVGLAIALSLGFASYSKFPSAPSSGNEPTLIGQAPPSTSSTSTTVSTTTTEAPTTTTVAEKARYFATVQKHVELVDSAAKAIGPACAGLADMARCRSSVAAYNRELRAAKQGLDSATPPTFALEADTTLKQSVQTALTGSNRILNGIDNSDVGEVLGGLALESDAGKQIALARTQLSRALNGG